MKTKISVSDELPEKMFLNKRASLPRDNFALRKSPESLQHSFSCRSQITFAKNSFPFDRLAELLYSTQTFLQLADFDLKILAEMQKRTLF